MQTGHRFSSDLSTGAGRSNFNPPPSPGIRRKAKASWSSRAKPGRTRAGRAAKKRHGILGSISSSVRAQEIVKRQGWRSGFGAPTRKERRRKGRRSRVTGWSSLRLIPHRRAWRGGLCDLRQRVQQLVPGALAGQGASRAGQREDMHLTVATNGRTLSLAVLRPDG